MRAKLANPNDCAAPFLSRAEPNLCWYLIRKMCIATLYRCIGIYVLYNLAYFNFTVLNV